MKKLFTILALLSTLNVFSQVTITPNTSSICVGQTDTLTVQVQGYGTDTLVFQWLQNSQLFGAPSNDTISVTPAVGIWNYSVAVSTPGGQFIGTGFATVTVNQLPTAIATGGAFCQNSTISLTGSGGTSYSWSGPNGFSSSLQNPSLSVTLAANGTYSLVVTNANGCSDSTTAQVVVNGLPVPIVSVSPNDTVCAGTQVALFATGGVSYLWSNAATTASITATPSVGNTTYSATVTDGNGCSASASRTITVYSNPVVNATGTDALCNGGTGSATVSATVGSPFTYLWNTSATTQSISSLTPGVYTATVTNSFGCSASDTAVVSQPTVLTAVISGQTNVSCNGGSNGTATVSVTGGTSPYTYLWSNGGTNSSTGGLSAGNYTVTITDAGGCSITATGTVGQPTILTANADSSAISCNGGNNGTVWVLPNGGTPPYDYVWSNTATTQYVSGLTAGTYGVTVTDANGCTTTSSTVVLQPVAITLSAAITPVTCNSGNNGSIDLTVSGGTSPYTYLWNTGSTVQDPSGLVAGTKTVTVTDANGCSASGGWVVNQPSALVLIASSTNATCVANGTASVSVSGGTGPYNYLWSGNNGTNSSISAPAGIYTVTVTDGNGCQAVMSDAIGQPIVPVITGNPTDVSCFGFNDGSIDMTPSGVGPFIYNWSNGSTAQDLTNLGAGIYTVIVTGANSCIGTNQFTVGQPANLTANVPNNTVNCYGDLGSLTVSATGGTSPYTYGWNTVPGQTTQTATNLSAGLGYTAIVVDANGCTAVANAVVTQPSQLLAVISNQQNITCAGNSNGSATVSVVGGTPNYSLLWSTGAQTQTAYGLSAGSYTVTVTDANGCTATTTATISTTGSSLYANMTSDPSCGNSNTGSVTASVSGGQQPYQYQWNNGATSPIVSGLAPGNYSVTITDANGCSWQGSQQILGSPAIVVNLTSQVLCEGNNDVVDATFSGGTWPYQFTWTSPLGNIFTTQGINPSQEGVYELLIVDNYGCTGYGMMPVDLIPCNTGIGDIDNERINIFPNPISSGQELMLRLPSNIQEVTVEVKNVVGQTLLQGKTNNDIYTLHTSGLAAGTYFVQIATANQSAFARKKLVVQ